MGIKNYVIEKLSIWLEPVFDRISERKAKASLEEDIRTADNTFKDSTDAAIKIKGQLDTYVSQRKTKKLTEDVTNMVKWDLERKEIQKLKKPKVAKVNRSTTTGRGINI